MDSFLVQYPFGGGGGGTPLRYASPTNFYPTGTATYNLGTAGGNIRTDVYQDTLMTVGQDMTSMTLAVTTQFIKAGFGISNVGNSINVLAMSVVYNGAYVAVTTAGSQTFTINDIANWFSDAMPSSAFGGAVKFTKGTTFRVKLHFLLATPTDKFPTGRVKQAADAMFYADPTKITVINDVYSTGVLNYSMANGGVNNTDAKFGTPLNVMVLGNHTQKSFALLGDSKTNGTGETTTPAIMVLGVSRVFWTNPATISSVQASGCNMGCPSGIANDVLVATASGNVALHEVWYTFANYAIVGYGTNALTQSAQTSMWARLRAKGIVTIIQRSLTPHTTPTNTDPVTVTLTTDTVTTTITGTMADTSGLSEGQSYPISGATGANAAIYNGTFAIHIVNATTFTYTAGSVPTANPTGSPVLDDQWRTVQYQTTATGWSVGGTADVFEQFLSATVNTDANFIYYQSLGERASPTLGTTNYWRWAVNGTVKYSTNDGLHESSGGYELNLGTNGTVISQSGGSVSQSLRALVGALT